MDLPGFSRKRVQHYTHVCPRCKQSNISAGDFEPHEEDLTEVKQEFVCDACGLEWYLKFEFDIGYITSDLEGEG